MSAVGALGVRERVALGFLALGLALCLPTVVHAQLPERGISHDDSWRRGVWWNADFEAGGGLQWEGDQDYLWYVGGRVGITLIDEPWFINIGGVVEWPGPDEVAFGAEAELMHSLSGYWGQIGVVADLDAHIGLTASVGWSLVGIEARFNELETGEPTYGLVAKLRIPISLIVLAVTE